MTPIKAAVLAMFFTIGSAFGLSSIKNRDTLRCVTLEGFRDSHQARWCAGSREGKGHTVIFYSTPHDKEAVESASACIGDETGKRNGPKVYYVVNKKRVNVPAMILQHMLKTRSKKYPDITYCIDNEEKLPTAWRLDPLHAYIVVLDEYAIAMFVAVLPLKQSECAELKGTLAKEP